MHGRTFWFVVVLAFLPGITYAHGHTWDFYGGGAFAEGSVLKGGRVSFDTTLPTTSLDWSFVVDSIYATGTHEDEVTGISENARLQAYQFGFRKAVNGADDNKYVFSVHALSGAVHSHLGGNHDTRFVFTFGGSYELMPHSDSLWSIRIQGERTAVKNGKDFFQASVGVVIRKPKP